jgi:hypothetical protein
MERVVWGGSSLTVATATNILNDFIKACEFISHEVYERRGKVVCEIGETKITVKKDTFETKVTDETFGLQRWDYLKNVTFYVYTPTRQKVMTLNFKTSPGLTIAYAPSGVVGYISPPFTENVSEKINYWIGEDFRKQYASALERARRARLMRTPYSETPV